MQPGSEQLPLRVAVIGAGPAGFYTTEMLLASEVPAAVDLFDALPSPHGLVRYGVAPDHPKMRTVTDRFDRNAQHAGFNFFGNVRFGTDISLEELREFYDAIVLTTGVRGPKLLGVPGEDLPGVFSAGMFIEWYNCKPDAVEPALPMEATTAAIIGNGNVALDVARMFCRDPEEFASTDIAEHALEYLRRSKVRHVVILGRRGLAQASFTHPEVAELEHLSDCNVIVDPADLVIDDITREQLQTPEMMHQRRFMPIFERLAQRHLPNASRTLEFRFLRRTLAVEGDGGVERLVLGRNRLELRDGEYHAVPTDERETLPCQMIFTCVGYAGEALPGVPFDQRRGIIPNDHGRVVDHGPVPGLYTAGWIKRGPSGVIGTNKVCSKDTVEHLLADLPTMPCAPQRDSAALRQRLVDRGVHVVDFEAWRSVANEETERGRKAGKPRERIATVDEMLQLAGPPTKP